MHISSKTYKLAELTKDNLEVSARLLAQTFLAENKVWSVISPNVDDATKFMYDKTSEMLDWQQELRDEGIIPKETFINFVYLDEENNVIGVWTNFQLTQYLSKSSKVKLPQFDFLEMHGAELLNGIDPSDKVPSKSIQIMFTALNPLKIGKGTSVNFWMDVSTYLHSQGFGVLYGRCSSVRSYGFLMKAGGVMTGKKVVVDQHGQQLTLSFVRTPCTPEANSLVLEHQQRKKGVGI